jgi:hypothetical protein
VAYYTYYFYLEVFMKRLVFSGSVRVCRGIAALIAVFLVMLSGCKLLGDKEDPTVPTEAKTPVVDVPGPGEPVDWKPTTSGYYLIELWGAEGWNPPPSVDPLNQYGGKGAYVCGILEITPAEVEEGIVLTLEVAHIGGAGINGEGGKNGGGSNASSGVSDSWSATGIQEGAGGGASDIRWRGDKLQDRIIVAAGGGGANDTSKVGDHPSSITPPPFWKGGYGGAFTGGSSNAWSTNGSGDKRADPGYGATQIAGGVGGSYISGFGKTGEDGSFGKGGSYKGLQESAGGGGGGYWGGGAGGQLYWNGGGGGGSSFISGYPGCVAIVSVSNTTPRSGAADSVEKATHYSGKVFIPTLTIGEETYITTMIAGNAEMPAPEGGTEIGHSGDGYAKISYLGELVAQ